MSRTLSALIGIGCSSGNYLTPSFPGAGQEEVWQGREEVGWGLGGRVAVGAGPGVEWGLSTPREIRKSVSRVSIIPKLRSRK